MAFREAINRRQKIGGLQSLFVAFFCISALLTGAAKAEAQESEWFGRDKALHFGASLAIAAGGYGLGASLSEERGFRMLAGGLLAVAAGGAKEMIDLAGYGTPDWRDFVWDMIGAVVGLFVAWAFDLSLSGRHRRGQHRSAVAFASTPP